MVIAPEMTLGGRGDLELFQVFGIFGPRRGSLAVLCAEEPYARRFKEISLLLTLVINMCLRDRFYSRFE